jgi:hypothetical protein
MVYYRHYCPYCGKVTGLSLRGYGVRLGPGSKRCSSCERVFPDGTKKWPQLTPKEKKDFLWGETYIWLIMLAFMIVVALYKQESNFKVLLAVTGLLFVLFLFQMTIRGTQILASKQRSK